MEDANIGEFGKKSSNCQFYNHQCLPNVNCLQILIILSYVWFSIALPFIALGFSVFSYIHDTLWSLILQKNKNSHPWGHLTSLSLGIICSIFYLLYYLSRAQKVAYYAQYYDNNYPKYAPVYMQFYYF